MFDAGSFVSSCHGVDQLVANIIAFAQVVVGATGHRTVDIGLIR